MVPMTFLPQSSWRYALLIIILFAIVAVAAATIISQLQDQIGAQPHAETIRQLSIAIWALTMGCLFLAGALGLWAIRSTTEIEGRRRVGRFVDTMDFLGDGLLAVDGKGRIRGGNPAARGLVPQAWPARKTIRLPDIFPCLAEQDLPRLLDPVEPQEVERNCVYREGLRILRFRSQPTEGLILILISDITERHAQEIRQRQVAQLQIIGRIAAGVAHDFNSILCAISGHAMLLQRLGLDPENLKRSMKIITEETQKGVQLSRQLLELSRSGAHDKPSENLTGNVAEASALLRTALSPEWVVKSSVQGSYPAVPLAPAQIEQVVVNLGLLAADAQPGAGTVTISLNQPGSGTAGLDVGAQYAAVILVSGESAPAPARPPAAPVAQPLRAGNATPSVAGGAEAASPSQPMTPVTDEGGVISSVVRTMVEEAQGRFDQMQAPSGLCVYRVCLPHLDTRTDLGSADKLSIDRMAALLARWRIMLAGADNELDLLATKLLNIGSKVERQAKVGSILASVEQTRELDALVMDKGLLGENAHNLMKALRTLRPQLGIVVLGQAPKHMRWPEDLGIFFVPHGTNPEMLFRSLLAARSAARHVVI
ncbi:MAG: hypothetical protein HYV36_04940 [Lentisphaerae bacterium]|nr:hypothetical protein [Lentisphaerota bacterium]